MAGYVHGITREDVFEAASIIYAGGKNPTQASVRSRLGKGSFSTISKYLSEWRQQQTDAEAIISEEEEMPDEVGSLLKRTYAAIRVHVETTVIGGQVELLEAENEKLRAKVADYEAVKAELAGVRFGYQELLAKVEQLTRENERLSKFSSEVDQLEVLTQERDRLALEVQKLKDKAPGVNKARTSKGRKVAGE
jgi:cell division protein FtsB